jgi:hypothetical protein
VAAAVSAGAFMLAPEAARAADCPNQSVGDRLDAADVAFVGRVLSRTAVSGAGIAQFDYRFIVFQSVKGDALRYRTVRAQRLVDLDGRVLLPSSKIDVGVVATRSPSGTLVTSSCGLVDAGSLLGAADEPKGSGIKVVIGAVILALVLAYSVRRLRRKQRDAHAPPL